MCGNCRRAQLPVHRSIMRLHALYLAEHLLFVAPTYAPRLGHRAFLLTVVSNARIYEGPIKAMCRRAIRTSPSLFRRAH